MVSRLGGKASGGRLNIKIPSYQYRDSHVKDKTVSPTVLSLTWESTYLGKTVFILRRGPVSLVDRSPGVSSRQFFYDPVIVSPLSSLLSITSLLVNTPPNSRIAIVVCCASVDCDIVTSPMHILWRHATDCSQNSRAFFAPSTNDCHSFIIVLDSLPGYCANRLFTNNRVSEVLFFVKTLLVALVF